MTEKLKEEMRHDDLLNEVEREPVIVGIVYLLLVIAALAGVVVWLVLRTSH